MGCSTSSDASAPGWSMEEPESNPPVISSSTGDHTADSFSKWCGSKRGTLCQLGLPLTYEEHTVRVRSNRCWVKLRGDEFNLLLQQSWAYPDLTNGHPPPWTGPSHHGPGCKHLLVQWPEHTKLLLGTLPFSSCYLIPECHSPHSSVLLLILPCDSSVKS